MYVNTFTYPWLTERKYFAVDHKKFENRNPSIMKVKCILYLSEEYNNTWKHLEFWTFLQTLVVCLYI